MKYFYTYRLPFSPNTKFDYWKVKDADECINKAFSKYKTTEFHIEETTKESYNFACGNEVVKTRVIYLTEAQVEILKRLIGEPTSFENMTNEEFVKNGLEDIMEQLQEDER